MWLTALAVCLILTIIFVILYIKGKIESGLPSLFGFLLVGFLGICMYMTGSIKQDMVLDQKIAMYKEENTQIEMQINEILSNYQAYESTTFKELNPSDTNAMALISLFPELKSNTLVERQIAVYIANNDKIKELQEEQIDLSRKKWFLYFGG